LTAKLIDAALDSQKPQESAQQAVQEETSSTDFTHSSEEILSRENTVNPMPTEPPQQQSQSTQSPEDIQTASVAMEAIQELIVLYRRIDDLEERLRAIDGETAEKLINTLRSQEF
jgi:hypothetical protein